MAAAIAVGRLECLGVVTVAVVKVGVAETAAAREAAREVVVMVVVVMVEGEREVETAVETAVVEREARWAEDC